MAMALKFVYTFEKEDSREYANLRTVVREGAKRILSDNAAVRYRVGVNGTTGILRGFEEAKERARYFIKNKPLGAVVRMQAVRADNKVIGAIRWFKVDDAPIADTPGVLGIDRWAGYLNANFVGNGTFRYAGICVCKPSSDHRDCAACDNFDTRANMEKQRDEAIARADYYQSKYLILFDKIYAAAYGFAPRPHTGEYHTHVHLSVFGGITGSAC